MMLSPQWRKLGLFLHVTSSVGFLGAVGAFLALAITGAAAEPELAHAAYRAMQVITWQVIVPLAFASLIIGIAQSLGTPWGLFRYYWVLVKLSLTLIAVAVLMLQTQAVDALSAAAGAGDLTGLSGARFSMVLHGSGGVIVLVIANVISIYKPRGSPVSPLLDGAPGSTMGQWRRFERGGKPQCSGVEPRAALLPASGARPDAESRPRLSFVKELRSVLRTCEVIQRVLRTTEDSSHGHNKQHFRFARADQARRSGRRGDSRSGE